MSIRMMCRLVLLALFPLFLAVTSARAQEEAAAPASDAPVAEEEPAALANDIAEDYLPASLFFTPQEVDIIRSAIQGVVSDVPDATETGPDGAPVQPLAPVKRLIRVSGMLYKNAEEWTVWINGNRVTPTNLLPEIVGIRVDHKSVRLQWTDKKKNQVIEITLRPNQVYDLDTGILLPG